MHQDNQLKSWKWFQKSNYELFLHVPHRLPRQTPVLSMCATALSPEGPGLPGQRCEPAHCSLGSNAPLWTPLRFLSACPCLPSGLPHPLPPRSRLCAHPAPRLPGTAPLCRGLTHPCPRFCSGYTVASSSILPKSDSVSTVSLLPLIYQISRHQRDRPASLIMRLLAERPCCYCWAVKTETSSEGSSELLE